jgi:tetratricopeptide (TPR) repeat protein
VYAGAEVDVRCALFDGDSCFVTFSPANAHDSGWAEALLLKRQISAVHLVAKWNHWWQPDEVRDAVRLAAEIVHGRPYRRVVTYGASMGGYGAALYARPLRADTAILVAPQFSIAPGKVPGDERWHPAASRIRFRHDDMEGALDPGTRKVLIYDPYSADRRHAALYEAHPNTVAIHVPFCGHFPLHPLKVSGYLSRFPFDVAEGSFEPAAFYPILRQARRRSMRYWQALSEKAESRRPELAIHALREAIRLAPRNVRLLLRMALLLQGRGDLPAAIRHAERARELAPEDAPPHARLGGLYAQVGRLADALACSREAVRLSPDTPRFLLQLSDIHRRLGDRGEALDLRRRAEALRAVPVP